jgi:PPOX class probable F420-dependent enzyme
MTDLETVASYLTEEHGLAVVSTTRADGSVLSSVVNCGVLDHPVTGERCVAFVSRGAASRLAHIRRGSEVTIAIRRGWRWVSVSGSADLIGPADPSGVMDTEAVRVLLRDVFSAAGGTHDNWDEYDQAMIDDGRTAVLVAPGRVLGNAPSG